MKINGADIRFYYINLERDESRRSLMEESGRKWGIPLERVVGVDGSQLTPAERSAYDARRRSRCFPQDLGRGEHGCILSMLRAMDCFLASDAEYAVIMEDDTLLNGEFIPRLQYLLGHTDGWQCVKLYTCNSPNYQVVQNPPNAPVELVFPKKIPWGAIAWLYRREAVVQLRKAFSTYWMPFDVQLVYYMFALRLPSCGVWPNMVKTSDPHNEHSTIDTIENRSVHTCIHRSLLQKIRYRLYVAHMSCEKKRTRKLLARRLTFH